MSLRYIVHTLLSGAHIAFTWHELKHRMTFRPPLNLPTDPLKLAQALKAQIPLPVGQDKPPINLAIACLMGGSMLVIVLFKTLVLKLQGMGFEDMLSIEKASFFFVSNFLQVGRITIRWLLNDQTAAILLALHLLAANCIEQESFTL